MRNAVIFTVGLGIAAAGLINALPAIWFLPRLGPLPLEPTRAAVMAAALIIAMLSKGFSSGLTGLGPKTLLAAALDGAVILLGLYALLDYVLVLAQIKQDGLMLFDMHHALVTTGVCVVFLVAVWRMWGLPLTLTALVALFYYFTCQYWPGIFEAAAPDFIDNFPSDIWYNIDKGILGTIVGIVIPTVLPFIILGAILNETGGGQSLIRIAFRATRHTRGGPAHTAIVASAMFGSMSGAAVANVVGTGTITIPMIKRRGFSSEFAGGVEAAASSGGQIVPPVMGTAALVMSDYLQIPYLTICVAAILPAFFYYLSLFFAVVLESRRLSMAAPKEDEEGMALNRQDWVNLSMVVVPLLLIVVCLVAGFSPGGAGVFAVLSVIPLSFLNATVRAKPWLILTGLARGGRQFSGLMIAVSAVGIIVAVLSTTGLPNDFAFMIADTTDSLFITLIVVMAGALCLGMGLPTLPAYLTIVIVLGPSLVKLGLPLLVAHMFVFYYGICAHITPPVGVAAFAAATIAEAPPMKTSFMTVRIGLAKFLIPFVFAYYPVLMLVKQAGGFDLVDFASIFVRLTLSLWLLSSAMALFDRRSLTWMSAGLRLALGVAVLVTWPLVHWPATAIALIIIFAHYRQRAPAPEPQTLQT